MPNVFSLDSFRCVTARSAGFSRATVLPAAFPCFWLFSYRRKSARKFSVVCIRERFLCVMSCFHCASMQLEGLEYDVLMSVVGRWTSPLILDIFILFHRMPGLLFYLFCWPGKPRCMGLRPRAGGHLRKPQHSNQRNHILNWQVQLLLCTLLTSPWSASALSAVAAIGCRCGNRQPRWCFCVPICSHKRQIR